MKSYIKAISYYLPEKILSNQELIEEFPEWSVEKIANKVGIDQRHIVDEKETSLDLAHKAIEAFFVENKDINKHEIDFILLCTQSPDYFLPTSACILQDRVQLPTTCGALDFNLGCSGYVYGLSLAKGLIMASVAKNVLLVTAETYSKFIHSSDKGNRTIFGDAASVTLVSTEGFAEICNFELGTDGSGAKNLIVENGAMRNRYKKQDSLEEYDPKDHLFMNGSEIFSFTQEQVPVLVQKTLEKNNLSINDINQFVFHQANTYMLNFIRKKLKIDEDRFYLFMKTVGNTVSSTIPIALFEAKNENKLKGNILLAGFGVGYSWGGCVLKVQK